MSIVTCQLFPYIVIISSPFFFANSSTSLFALSTFSCKCFSDSLRSSSEISFASSIVLKALCAVPRALRMEIFAFSVNLVNSFYQFFSAFFGQRWHRKADYATIINRIKPEISGLNCLFQSPPKFLYPTAEFEEFSDPEY